MSRGAKGKIKPIPVVEKSADDFLEEFIQACLKVDSSEDMSTIISKKVRKHYTKVHPSFKKSIAFINFLKNLLSKVVKDHSNVYVHISDLTCELKARKDFSEEEEGPKSKKKKTSEEKVEDVDYEDLEIKRNVMKIKKLNKALTKIQKTIQDLESREVDWDDDDNSTYIMLQRYKERAVKIFNKLCEITKESKTAGNLSKVHFSGTPFPEVDKCIQQFVNETRQFPDFVDICEVIRSSSEKNNLKLTDKEIQDHAEKAFKIIGKELQRQRIHGHTESLLALIEGGDDPADTDKELEEQLTKNQAHWQNINKVIDEFAEKAKNKKTSANQLDSKEDEEGIDDDNDCDDEDDEEESEEETSDQKDDDNLSNLSSASDGEDSNIDDGIDEGLDEDVKEEEILQEESKSDDKETEEPEAEKKSMDPTEGKTDNLE